jgi:hypothetical protein
MVDPARSSSGSLRRTQDIICGVRSSAVSAHATVARWHYCSSGSRCSRNRAP